MKLFTIIFFVFSLSSIAFPMNRQELRRRFGREHAQENKADRYKKALYASCTFFEGVTIVNGAMLLAQGLLLLNLAKDKVFIGSALCSCGLASCAFGCAPLLSDCWRVYKEE